MLSEKDYADAVFDTDVKLTCKILENKLADDAVDLIDGRSYRAAIAFLEAAQALKLAEEKYNKAFRIMNGEE